MGCLLFGGRLGLLRRQRYYGKEQENEWPGGFNFFDLLRGIDLIDCTYHVE